MNRLHAKFLRHFTSSFAVNSAIVRINQADPLSGINPSKPALLTLQIVLHADRQAFAGVFVNHRQEPYRPAGSITKS